MIGVFGPKLPVAPRRAFLVAAIQALRSDGARQPRTDIDIALRALVREHGN